MQLKSIYIKKSPAKNYPFNLDLISNFPKLQLEKPITIIVGENGSGKSTLLEGLAIAASLNFAGSDSFEKDTSLGPARELAKYFQLSWTIRNRRGFFMRAEDFFGFQKRINSEIEGLKKQTAEFEQKFTGYAKILATGSSKSQTKSFEKTYGENPDAFSHGESFLNFLSQRLVPGGLYILDEPEAPLSLKSQLTFIALINNAVQNESQFIIATHSPILMAVENSTLYEINNKKLVKVKYDELEQVSLLKNFLQNPQRFLKHL